MSWNYRIVKRCYPDHNDIFMYSIHEAYYDEGKQQAHSITTESVELLGDTPEELKKDLEYMLEAFNKPILNYEDF